MSTRIAIVRLTSLGDVIHALPLVAAIREHRPDASITWIVEEHEQVLLRGNPTVDEIVLAPLRRWRRWAAAGRIVQVLREIREFRARLHSLHIDVTIDVQGWTHKTSPIVALTRAPMRIGFSRTHARRPWSTLFTTHHVTPPPSAAHIVDQNLALLQPLGIAAAGARFVFPSWPDAERRVDQWMAAHGNGAGRPIVLLPSTRGRRKFWPVAAYAALIQRLAATTECVLVVAGSPAERLLLDEIQARARVSKLHAYMPGPITDLARFLPRAALVVGNDTGPLHLAAAAAVPTIGLFGPTRGARNGPYGSSGVYIQSPSGRMADIAVDTVFAAATGVLNASSPR
jgi:lipopolysaccharide heptosyltransferase I